MPDYIRLPGEHVVPPPYDHSGATMHGYVMLGDAGAIQTVVDTTLNRVPGMHFESVSRAVMLVALYVDAVTTTAPGYENRGSAPETDIGFWIPVRGGRVGGPKELFWFPLYLFVDSITALVIGREVYGYPKLLGDARRADPGQPGNLAFTLRTSFFDRYAPDARPIDDVLFEIESTTPAVPPVMQDIDPDALFALLRELFEIDDAAHGLPRLAMPMVFVKQFRDIARPAAACYLAATAVAVEATRVRSISVIVDALTLKFRHSVNIDIAADLGLTSGTPVALAYSIDHDFRVGPGRVL